MTLKRSNISASSSGENVSTSSFQHSDFILSPQGRGRDFLRREGLQQPESEMATPRRLARATQGRILEKLQFSLRRGLREVRRCNFAANFLKSNTESAGPNTQRFRI